MDFVAVRDVDGAGGYTPALRQIATLGDGSTVFVKTPTNDVTRWMLNDEIDAYALLGPRPFCPRVLDASPHRLVLEDLSHGYWPPPWREGDVARVIDALQDLASTTIPGLRPFDERQAGNARLWSDVDVDAVAALGFDEALVADLAAAGREIDATCSYEGDALLHMDLRSDNVCLLDDGRVVLVDWNGACAGQAGMDEVCWAPSLTLEGGPQPWELLPDAAPHHVAFIAGYFAHRSPLPPIPDAPRVRPFQLAQLRVCLPWFARVLEV